MSADESHAHLVMAAGLAYALRGFRRIIPHEKPAKPVYRDARHRRQVEAKLSRQAAAAKRGKRS